LLALILCLPILAHGADNVPDAARTVSERVVEPSPDVATMRRYTDCPVSYATGSASVDIPLMSLSTPSLSVSLGLSYRCEAKKVEEPAGWVGLGWTLTGLGSVSRQICGMPDDKSDGYLDLKDSDFNLKKKYFDDLINLKKDSNHDRYTIVTPDGQSASFILDGTIVYMLAPTELKVWHRPAPDNEARPEVFYARTPDGTYYEFARTEKTSYKYHPGTLHAKYVYPDYEAVTSWHLTKIANPERTDSIVIEYTEGTPWQAFHGSTSIGTISYSFEDCNGGSRSCSGGGGDDSDMTDDWGDYQGGNGQGGDGLKPWVPVDPGDGNVGKNPNPSLDGPLRSAASSGAASYGVTKYSPLLPRVIRAATGSIVFAFESEPSGIKDYRNGCADRLGSVELRTAGNAAVSKAVFESSSLGDGRRTLHSLEIRADNGIADGYSFEYNPSWDNRCKDLFGYPNGVARTPSWESVLGDSHLKLSKTRRTNADHLHDGLLRRMHSCMGITTEFAYEPSHMSLPDTSYLFCDEITIGTRIKSITTTDNRTERIRTRTFEYSDAVLSARIDSLGAGAFLAPSGTVMKTQKGMSMINRYDMSVTFTGSSRLPGMPVENTRIYYAKVEETVSGTDIDQPTKYCYEYDLSHCMSKSLPYGNPGIRYDGRNGVKILGIESFTEADGTRLGHIFSTHFIDSYFMEIIGGTPMLTKKTAYAWRGGAYVPATTETHSYTCRTKHITVGLSYEHMAFKEASVAVIENEIQTASHMDYGYIQVEGMLVQRTGTRVTRHYPGGKERTVSARYDYYVAPKYIPGGYYDSDSVFTWTAGRHPGFVADSLEFRGAFHYYHRPRGVTYRCGSDSISRYDLYSDDINRTYFKDMHNRYVPVAQKWVVAGSGYRDSLETEWLYGKFHGMTRPVRETVSRHGAVLDRASYTAYNGLGLPTAMTRRDGSEYSMGWDGYGNLTSKKLASVGLENRYTYKPLVGCTSISYPSGRRKYFSYDNGRLSLVRNSANEPVASYEYSMANPGLNWGAQGENTITSTVYTASGAATHKAVYDGFGMQVSDIAVGFGGDGGDVVTNTEYDALDRAVRLWQPLPVGQENYYNGDLAYTDNVYDTDGSERVVSTTAPGKDMIGHPATAEYLCNTQSGELRCRRFVLEGERLTDKGAYADASLDVVRAIDADGHRVLTFNDWRGRTVLVRKVLAEGRYIDTYTVYDHWGNVAVVLQPMAEGGLKGGSYDISDGGMDEVIEKYAYVYRYDDALRPVYAKLPGCDPVTTVYDPDGLVAYTVDGNLRAGGNARFTLYDAAARPVVTGICNEPTGVVPRMRATLDTSANGLDKTGYTTEAPLSGVKVLTATYYDGYDCLALSHFESIPDSFRPSGIRASGLVTATLDRVLSGSLNSRSAKYVATMTGYDSEEHPTRVAVWYPESETAMLTENVYNIDGTLAVMNNKLMHPTGEHTDSHTYAYDAAGRLVKETVSYDGGEAVDVQKLSYNAIGTLSGNDLGVFNEEYTYNVRGAMTKRKSAVFEQTIAFSNHFDRLYNGSIGMIVDKLTGGKSTSSGYSYDNAGRLTSAMIFFDGITHPTGYTYDLNSNITTLNRRGYNPTYVAELIDDLVYQYDGNQVKKITEKAPVVISEKTMNFIDGADLDVEYSYDRNGNMTGDANKGLEMGWDYNNRLYKVEDDEMTMTFNRTGSGQKLGKSVYVGPKPKYPLRPGLFRSPIRGTGGTFIPVDTVVEAGTTVSTEYFGAYEYINGKFAQLNTSTGYRDSVGTHVYVRDWQGNIRAVVRKGDDGSTVLEQATYYYPYGMPMAESTNPTANSYKYTGKELFTDKGFNCYDYGARFYDPATGIWLSADPLSSLRPDYSPYRFNYCNPINYVDPTGLFETKEEASKWAKEHNIKTGIFRYHQIEQQDDQSWAIVNRSGGYQYDRDADLSGWSNVVGMGDDGVVKSAISLASDYSFAWQCVADVWNSPNVRGVIPDFLSLGIGFSASGGPNSNSSIELNWVLRGPEAFFAPLITVTQGFGVGTPSADLTLNIGQSWYLGSANNLKRSMLETRSYDATTIGTPMQSGYVSIAGGVGPSIGITANMSSSQDSITGNCIIIGVQKNLGFGGQPGISIAGGGFNTIIIKDFAQ